MSLRRLLQPFERQLFLAAHRGDVLELQKICAEHTAVNVNIADEAEYTPLTIAILENRLPVVQALVSTLGADISLRGKHGQTPIQLACEEGHLSIVALLVEQGADPNEAHDKQGNLLHIATLYDHLDIVQWLIQVQGMSVDTPSLNDRGHTALHIASIWHRTEILDWLLQHGGANPRQVDQDGKTALHHAVARPKSSAAPAIPRQLLQQQQQQGRENLEVRDHLGRTPLHEACHRRNAQAVLLLLQAGANPFSVDAWGRTPLYEVATGGKNATLLQAMLQVLLQQQGQEQEQQGIGERRAPITRETLLAELQRADAQGWTPLHHAIACGETAIVQTLLSFGVKVTPLPVDNNKTKNKTILHLVGSGLTIDWDEYTSQQPYAGWDDQYHLVADWMLRYGRWFLQYEQVKHGWPPLLLPPVPRVPEIQDLWDIKAGINHTEQQDDDNNNDFCMSQLLVDHGGAVLSVLQKDADGNLPFFLAAASGRVSEVFAQLRVAAHEGLFQHSQQQQQQPQQQEHLKCPISTGAVAAMTSPKRPSSALNKAFITPPRQAQRARRTYTSSSSLSTPDTHF